MTLRGGGGTTLKGKTDVEGGRRNQPRWGETLVEWGESDLGQGPTGQN